MTCHGTITGSGESENEAPVSCLENVATIRSVGKRCPKCKGPSVAAISIVYLIIYIHVHTHIVYIYIYIQIYTYVNKCM